MSKTGQIKYGVEGFAGVQRNSDRVYTHAVVVVADVVARAEFWAAQARGPQSIKNCLWRNTQDTIIAAAKPGDVLTRYGMPETAESIAVAQGFLAVFPTVEAYHASIVKAADAEVVKAKAEATAGVLPEVLSFHGSYALAVKAMNAAVKGISWREASVAPVTIL